MNTTTTLQQPESPSLPGKQHKFPSRFMVSLYLPIGILILLGASFVEVSSTIGYFIGIGAEIALAIIAIIFLKMEKLPVGETLRLRRPDWRHLSFAVLAVPGVWFLGIILNMIMALILDYTTPVPPSYYPDSFIDNVLFAFSAVVVAPICEEIVFRGYFQRAFEKKSPWIAILIGGTIFAMYHLRFQGLFALLPIAFAMSYFAWRGDSIYISMLMHAIFNSIATFFMILNSNIPLMALGIIVLLVLAGAFVLLPGVPIGAWWVYKHSAPEMSKPAPTSTNKRTWKHYLWLLPFTLFLAAYVFFAYNEFAFVSYPEQRASDTIDFTAYRTFPEDIELEYEVANVWGKAIGQATCTRTSDEVTFSVTCSSDIEASDTFSEFEFDFMDSALTISTIPQTWKQTSTWSSELELIETNLDWESDGTHSVMVTDSDGTYTVTNDSGPIISENSESLSQGLTIGEFAWRLQRIPLELGDSYWTHIVIRDNDDGSYSSYKALVTVDGGEPVWTSYQQYTAWKITITYTDNLDEEQTLAVWYDANNPDYPVKFNNGDAEYVLKSVSPSVSP